MFKSSISFPPFLSIPLSPQPPTFASCITYPLPQTLLASSDKNPCDYIGPTRKIQANFLNSGFLKDICKFPFATRGSIFTGARDVKVDLCGRNTIQPSTHHLLHLIWISPQFPTWEPTAPLRKEMSPKEVKLNICLHSLRLHPCLFLPFVSCWIFLMPASLLLEFYMLLLLRLHQVCWVPGKVHFKLSPLLIWQEAWQWRQSASKDSGTELL